jgi:hypothetical protein
VTVFAPFFAVQSFLSPRSRDLKAPAAEDSKSKVDSDYIKVLQQQIFFLELKLNLMKKQAPAGGPTADTMAVPDGPLEDVIVSLRAKYIRLEQDYLRQIQVLGPVRCSPCVAHWAGCRGQELKARNEELDIRALHSERELENALRQAASREEQRAVAEQEFKQREGENLEQRNMLQDRLDRLQARLAKKDEDYDALTQRLAQHKADAQAAADRAVEAGHERDQRLRAAEKRVEELDRRLRAAEVENLEIREELKNSDAVLAANQQLKVCVCGGCLALL